MALLIFAHQIMSVLIILICVSICIAGAFLLAFIWSSNDGQFEDLYASAHRILFERKENQKKKNERTIRNRLL